MMNRIIAHTENHKLYRSIIQALQPTPDTSTAHAIAAAAADVADSIEAAAIIAFTGSGTTAMRAARKRPVVPIVSLSPSIGTARRLALLWGTHTATSAEIFTYDEMVASAKAYALSEGIARSGERIVIVAGIPFATIGTTNNIRVVRV